MEVSSLSGPRGVGAGSGRLSDAARAARAADRRSSVDDGDDRVCTRSCACCCWTVLAFFASVFFLAGISVIVSGEVVVGFFILMPGVFCVMIDVCVCVTILWAGNEPLRPDATAATAATAHTNIFTIHSDITLNGVDIPPSYDVALSDPKYELPPSYDSLNLPVGAFDEVSSSTTTSDTIIRSVEFPEPAATTRNVQQDQQPRASHECLTLPITTTLHLTTPVPTMVASGLSPDGSSALMYDSAEISSEHDSPSSLLTLPVPVIMELGAAESATQENLFVSEVLEEGDLDADLCNYSYSVEVETLDNAAGPAYAESPPLLDTHQVIRLHDRHTVPSNATSQTEHSSPLDGVINEGYEDVSFC